MISRVPSFPYLPKDFIETADGLVFAVVCYGPQDDKIGCFLRYVQTESGWQKVSTEQANTLLTQDYPHYLYYSSHYDATFHAVSPQDVFVHHRPEARLNELLESQASDAIVQKLQQLIIILEHYGAHRHELGVTGSLLLGCQSASSDIDLAVYGRHAFQQLRQIVQQAIAASDLSELSPALMRDNYQRRQGELPYDDFAWHEARKFNKAVIAGTKFDIGMVNRVPDVSLSRAYQKQGKMTLQAKVVDDQLAFDFPAQYRLDHPTIQQLAVYTQTYVGQAVQGEMIEASGEVERDIETGALRLVVGSTREALGEYVRVLHEGTKA